MANTTALSQFLELNVFDYLVNQKDPVSAFKLACAVGKSCIPRFTSAMKPDWISVGDYGVVKTWEGNQLLCKYLYRIVKIAPNGVYIKKCKLAHHRDKYNQPHEPAILEDKRPVLFRTIMGVKFDRTQRTFAHTSPKKIKGGLEIIHVYRDYKIAVANLMTPK